MNLSIEIIGLLAALLTTSAFVPQAFKIFRTKEVTNVSLTMYLVMFVGICLWLYYGLVIDSISIILANIITGIIVLSIIFFKIRYSKN